MSSLPGQLLVKEWDPQTSEDNSQYRQPGQVRQRGEEAEEEQQRIQLAKKQEERERRLRDAKYGKVVVGKDGKIGPGTIRLTSPGARPPQTPWRRPSFQYRDGAFICDLCKESFSDGNDMVTHWKSHVKKQQAEASGRGRGGARGRERGRGPGRGSGIRGRPPWRESGESDEVSGG